ncbi:MAG: bifunctional riboflavin kinase/FAD synthetase [Anaerolineales bacterium]|nr:bifunctional riboflavin kinase/FAD synthetase [Anaerolineales bacterium]
MRHIHSLEEISLSNSYLAIGVFDGVHRGHRALIEKMIAAAHAKNLPAVVLAFDPHPAFVLSGREIPCLTTPDERASLLQALGADVVFTQRFTRELSQLSAYEYISQLKARLGFSRLFVGYDFALGKGREGDAARLTEIGLALGYAVETVSALGGESGVVSSTQIRALIAKGKVGAAANLLGDFYRMSGEVIRGAGRGKQINCPTANVDYPPQKVAPPNGIYACWARLGGERFMAATNIGFNPTFTPERTTPSLEAHLLDFDRDIYGETLTLEFVAHLREEIRYSTVEALMAQIEDDKKQTRRILAG